MDPPPPDFVVLMPLPRIFHSFLEGGPFTECVICSRYLLDEGTQYLIEKSYVGEEVICEYAMCNQCHHDALQELSRESLQRIGAHMSERVDLVERRDILLDVSYTDADPWIDECILTRKKRSACRGYTIYAHCEGGDLMFSYLPFMVSDEGMRPMEKLLSKITREKLDDFIDEYLGLPPALKSQPGGPNLILM